MTSTALQACSGQVMSGSITAVLGPSGSGKSTLLNCVMGRLPRGQFNSGQCHLRVSSSLSRQLEGCRISYVPQVTEFLTLVSVRETLLFASRLNSVSTENHDTAIVSILSALDMSEKLNWSVGHLSGGQMKRLAIACELISRPAVLVLDEPTSGLDADNAERLMMHLKSLVTCEQMPMKPAVLLSIHSPSADLFYSFDQVYIMAPGGLNIFRGPPSSVIQYFNSHGFSGVRGNPADWCVEVASGKFTWRKFTTMARVSRKMTRHSDAETIRVPISSMNQTRSHILKQVYLLTMRSLGYNFIKFPQAWVRILCHAVVVSLFNIILLREPLAHDSQCLVKSTDTVNDSSITSLKVVVHLRHQFYATKLVTYFLIIFLVKTAFVGPVACALTIIYHRQVHLREMHNNWYSRTAFFLSKLISDTIVRLACVTACGCLIYFLSSPSIEAWRIVIITFLAFIFSSIWENIASALAVHVGTVNNLLPIACFLMSLIFTETLFIDSIITKNIANEHCILLKRVSPINSAFSGCMVALFGLQRCRPPKNEHSLFQMKAESPRQVFSRTWHSLNVTRDMLAQSLDIYEIDEEITSNLYGALSTWVLPKQQFLSQQSSYVLSLFSYDEIDISRQLYVLATWLGLSSILLLYAVRCKFF